MQIVLVLYMSRLSLCRQELGRDGMFTRNIFFIHDIYQKPGVLCNTSNLWPSCDCIFLSHVSEDVCTAVYGPGGESVMVRFSGASSLVALSFLLLCRGLYRHV